MKKMLILSLFVLLAVTLAWAAHSISASSDANANQHPATYGVTKSVTVKCTSATQYPAPKPGDIPPACYLTGPWLAGHSQRKFDRGDEWGWYYHADL